MIFQCQLNNSDKIFIPLSNIEVLKHLKAGDKIFLTGELFVFRDQVHKKIAKNDVEQISNVNFNNSAVYYCSATPGKNGLPIGSCGPTSSYRMDELTEPVLNLGVKIMIGKGYRSNYVVELCKKYASIYLITYGGCGALINRWIKSVELIAYPELATEAMFKYTVENFEAIVAIDIYGNTLWKNFKF
ncbi:MAG: fumarate hydratase C-terminal domain-containing protein [Endomicrobia bacterium]|nr:fumarate hydratase C-terminal domain-containing protein [Endomicrobiia bacterium]